MLKFLKKQKIAVLGGVFAILSVFAVAIVVHAQASQDLRGYGWSSTIGWVSFSCKDSNTCGDVNYGVTVGSSGDLSGYGWSNNVGWINFDATGWPSGSGTTATSAKITGGQLVGWAKFLSGSASSGWDGWISFTGSNYGVTVSAPVNGISTMAGFAWGSSVVGWMDMSQVTVGAPAANGSTMQLYASVNGSGNFAANTTIGPYTSGAIITLSWDLNNMFAGNGCMASGTWVGPKTSGSGTGTFVNAPIQYVNLGTTQVTKTFTLTCMKPDGVSSLTQTINMLLNPLVAGTPTVQLFANSQPGGVTEPTVTVPSGPSNVSLSWSVHNVSPGWPPAPATSAPHCLAADDWYSTIPGGNIRPSNENTNNGTATDKHYANGMTVLNNTSQPILKTYTIKCTRPSDGVMVSSTVTVQVLPAAGTSYVTIKALPATIQPGQPSTVTYTTYSVIPGSCAPTANTTAAGATQLSVSDWTGANMVENNSDPQNVLVHAPGVINGEITTYTITCTGTDGATRQASATVMIGEGSSPLTLMANPGSVTTLNAPTALRWYNFTNTALHACVSSTTDVAGNPINSPWNGSPSGLNVGNGYALWTPLPGSTGPMNPPPPPTIPVPVNATIFKIDCLDQMNTPVHAQAKVPVLLGNLSVKLFTQVPNFNNIHQGDQIPLLWNSPSSSEFTTCQGTSSPTSVYEWVGNPTPIMSTKVPNAANGDGLGASGPFKMPISTPGWPATVTITGAPGTVETFTITCKDINGNQATSSLDIKIVSAAAQDLQLSASKYSYTENTDTPPLSDDFVWQTSSPNNFGSCEGTAKDISADGFTSPGTALSIPGWTGTVWENTTDPNLVPRWSSPNANGGFAFDYGISVPYIYQGNPFTAITKYIITCYSGANKTGTSSTSSVIVVTKKQGAGETPQIDLSYSGFDGLTPLGHTDLNWTSPNNTDFISCTASAEAAGSGWSSIPASKVPNSSNGNSFSTNPPGGAVLVTLDPEWYSIDCVDGSGQHATDTVSITKDGGPSGGAKKHPTFIECHGSDCAGQ